MLSTRTCLTKCHFKAFQESQPNSATRRRQGRCMCGHADCSDVEESLHEGPRGFILDSPPTLWRLLIGTSFMFALARTARWQQMASATGCQARVGIGRQPCSQPTTHDAAASLLIPSAIRALQQRRMRNGEYCRAVHAAYQSSDSGIHRSKSETARCTVSWRETSPIPWDQRAGCLWAARQACFIIHRDPNATKRAARRTATGLPCGACSKQAM